MYNWALIDKSTGKVLNAVSTPNEDVMPLAEDGQEVREITDADFQGIFDGNLAYYNYSTGQFEPEIIRELTLLTPGPYVVGTVSLQFQQQALDGTDVTEPTTFTVEVNGNSQDVLVDDGTLEIELNCPDPTAIHLKITAPRYKDVDMEVVVSG